MRVLMTCDAVGGIWQYTRDLAQGLAARGVSTIVAVLGPAPTQEQLATMRSRVILLDHLQLDWTATSPADVMAASAALARCAASVEADVVHLHAPALAVGGDFAMPLVAVFHSCVATWWDACGSGPLPTDLRWRRDLTEQGCRRADALLAPTAAFAAELEHTYALKRLPMVVRNGRARWQDALPLSSRPHVFTAGRLWDRAKNMETLDRVAARLTAPFFAAGALEGPNGEIVALPHLRLLGRIDDAAIAEFLDQRPIYVSLARYEPFGLAVLEAAQAGCPLVLSDIPTFRELWAGASLFIDPDDDTGAARAIAGLIADPGAAATWRARARRQAMRYSVAAMTDDVLGVFHDLYHARAARRMTPVWGNA